MAKIREWQNFDVEEDRGAYTERRFHLGEGERLERVSPASDGVKYWYGPGVVTHTEVVGGCLSDSFESIPESGQGDDN